MAVTADLGKDPIPSLFFRYYVPTLASIMSFTAQMIINGLLLGHYVGKDGVAAVGLYGPVVTIFIAFVLALAIGGGILISRSIGAGDGAQAREVLRFGTTLALAAGLVVAVSAPFVVTPLARFLVGGEHESLVQNTRDVMLWGFIGMPVLFLCIVWRQFLVNDGGPRMARNASFIAVALNIVLDFVIIGWQGWGTAGASIATALSNVCAMAYLFWYIRQGRGHLHFGNFRFTLYFPEWKSLFQTGVPTFLSDLSFSLGLLIINRCLVSYGELAVAAFGMVNHLSFIFLRLLTAAMLAALPIMSFNVGAKQPARVVAMLRFAMMFSVVIGVVVCGIGWLVPGALVRIFSADATIAFESLAAGGLSLYFLLFLAAGPNYILAAYFQSTGRTTMSIVVNLLKGVVLVVVFVWALPALGLGMAGMWLSRAGAEVATLVLVGGISLLYRQRCYTWAFSTPR
jgi:Na+-driven multidrug efflux pump